MTPALAAAGAQLGGIRRVVLGHAHADHRGAAAALSSAPTSSATRSKRADAEGDGGEHYMDLSQLDRARPDAAAAAAAACGTAGRCRSPGPSRRATTIAGFGVVHLPGHAPGPDRPVARVGPARARQRRVLHARPADGHARRTCAFRTRPSTTTPQRRARRSASSPRSHPRPPGRATPQPLTGDVGGAAGARGGGVSGPLRTRREPAAAGG